MHVYAKMNHLTDVYVDKDWFFIILSTFNSFLLQAN